MNSPLLAEPSVSGSWSGLTLKMHEPLRGDLPATHAASLSQGEFASPPDDNPTGSDPGSGRRPGRGKAIGRLPCLLPFAARPVKKGVKPEME
jgi:hypothetical protein